MGNKSSNTSTTNYQASCTYQSTTSYCPIFGLPRHTSILFSEPAWHFTNPLNLPLFGSYIITPKTQQIASKLTNNDLLQFSQVIEQRYANNDVWRYNLSPLYDQDQHLSPSTFDMRKQPIPQSINSLPQFYCHCQEVIPPQTSSLSLDAIDQDNNQHDKNEHLLITLPISFRPYGYCKNAYEPALYNITTPSTPCRVGEHLYYYQNTYNFPPPTQWDTDLYYYRDDVKPKTLLSTTSLQSSMKNMINNDQDKIFYTNFLPLRNNVTIHSFWPLHRYSFSSTILKPEDIYIKNKNIITFPIMILLLDLGDINSRKELSRFITETIKLRLNGFICNLNDIKLFLFLDPTHSDQIHQSPEETSQSSNNNDNIDIITTKPNVLSLDSLESFITLTPIDNASQPSQPSYDFHTYVYSYDEIFQICKLAGFKEENIFIHYLSLTSSQFPTDHIDPAQYYPRLYRPLTPEIEEKMMNHPQYKNYRYYNNYNDDNTQNQRTKVISQQVYNELMQPTTTSSDSTTTSPSQTVDALYTEERIKPIKDESTLSIIISIIRPHLINLPTITHKEYTFQSLYWYQAYMRRNLPTTPLPTQIYTKPYYFHTPLLPSQYLTKSQSKLTPLLIYQLKLLSFNWLVEVCSYPPLGGTNHFGYDLDSILQCDITRKPHNITITNQDKFNQHIYGKVQCIDYKETFNILTNSNTNHDDNNTTTNDNSTTTTTNNTTTNNTTTNNTTTNNTTTTNNNLSLTIPLIFSTSRSPYNDYLFQYQYLFATFFIPFLYDFKRNVRADGESNLFSKEYYQKLTLFPKTYSNDSLLNTNIPIHIIVVSMTPLPSDIIETCHDDYNDEYNYVNHSDDIRKFGSIRHIILQTLSKQYQTLCIRKLGDEIGELKFQQLFRFHFVEQKNIFILLEQIKIHSLRQRLQLILQHESIHK